MPEFWQLDGAVVLRPEAFGGMAFHRQQGITIEVDQEAYDFLCAYLTPGLLPPADHPAAYLVPQLVRLGFLQPAAQITQPASITLQKPIWAGDGATLSAPETVHLAITTRCNFACAGCYVPRPGGEPELTVADWCDLIAQWAQMRVFQIAVGGGEPLLYGGLFEVLACARRHGLVPNLTTNGALLDVGTVRRLQQAGVARVNVSWNSPGGEDRDRDQIALQALGHLLDSTIQVGVNLLATPALLPRLPEVFAQLLALGIRRVTVLRPKPPAIPRDGDTAWYDGNRLRRTDLCHLHAMLNDWQWALALEVDSALVSLMADADPAHLRWRGIHGCTAGRRICTVWPDGRATACSFLGDLAAGNVLHMPFSRLWKQGQNWERLRAPLTRPQSNCNDCAVAQNCGGVSCIARYSHKGTSIHPDLLAGDSECPKWR